MGKCMVQSTEQNGSTNMAKSILQYPRELKSRRKKCMTSECDIISSIQLICHMLAILEGIRLQRLKSQQVIITERVTPTKVIFPKCMDPFISKLPLNIAIQEGT